MVYDMEELRIKVCGLRCASNIADVGKLGPDFMGFIFYPPSPRYCGDAGPDLLDSVPEGVTPVAVTVDMPDADILGLCRKYGFNTVQLHGCESPEKCRRLRAAGLHVWKAVSVSGPGDLQAAEKYDGCVDLLVFDTAAASRGGSGRKFEWEWLNAYCGATGFMLSGGIAPEDADAVRGVLHPLMAGVDLNSRFETAPGVKDTDALRLFIRTLRSRDNQK